MAHVALGPGVTSPTRTLEKTLEEVMAGIRWPREQLEGITTSVDMTTAVARQVKAVHEYLCAARRGCLDLLKELDT